ncbi:YrhC family protein [Sporolactobacillus putidus]|uniref:YrhC-like protein n=1 Tax=Sporolactobacillus putidus TaxID=492735 RepID=A0A917RWP5_9BACL|nr:YrhC family protein [Sporolactobacillus putidus]GGL40587.1 hypothetical protein GCM10007968_00700 [Sporolactobacillus putidus]
MRDYEKIIQEKIIDCRRIAMLCLFLSAFLYTGTMMPEYADVDWKLAILSGASLAFLLLTFFFYWRTSKLKDRLDK